MAASTSNRISGEIYNVLWIGSSGEPEALRESVRKELLGRLGLTSGPYGEKDPLSGWDSGAPAGVGFMEDQHFPSYCIPWLNFGVKRVKWEIPSFHGNIKSSTCFETEFLMAMRHIGFGFMLGVNREE